MDAMRSIKIAKAGGRLSDEERLVLDCLLRCGYNRNGAPLGRVGAVAARDLAEALMRHIWPEGTQNEDLLAKRLESCLRRVRQVINQLIVTHRIPIICESGPGGGYYLPAEEGEVTAQYKRFHRRAMTGIIKASRGQQAAYANTMVQLTMGFDSPEGREALSRLGLDAPRRESSPTWYRVLTALLSHVREDPERYAAELDRLQAEYGDLLVPRKKILEIEQLTSQLSSVLRELSPCAL